MGKKSTTSNFLYSMVYQILLMILPLITAPYIARVLGAEGMGIYSYTHSIAEYFWYFSMLGIENYGNRNIAYIKEKGNLEKDYVFSSIYKLQLYTTAFSMFFYLIYILFISKNNFVIALIQIIYIISSFFNINWFFWGIEEFKLTITRQIIIKILNTISVFVFVKNYGDLWKYTLIMNIGLCMGEMILWIIKNKYVKFIKIPLIEIISHIKPILILFIPIIATSIYRVIGKIMLGAFSNMSQVGYYESSDKLIRICLCAISALGTVMLPKISSLVSQQKIKECEYYLRQSMQITMFIGAAITFGIASIANEFIPIFYGEKFYPSINITIILTLSVLFIAWSNVIRTQYLIPFQKDKVYVYSVCIGALVNFAINLLLIPRLGALGAAIGTILAEFSVTIFQTMLVRKYLNIRSYIFDNYVFIIFGVIMFLIVRLIAKIPMGQLGKVILEIAIGGSAYLILSFIYLVLKGNPLVRKLLRLK